MSMENVDLFYKRLDEDHALREVALSLKGQYPDPDDLLDAFIRLGREAGYEFTAQEYMQVMFRRACEMPDEVTDKQK